MIRHHLLSRSGSQIGNGGVAISPSPSPANSVPSSPSPYRAASPSPTAFFSNSTSSLRGSGETGSPLEQNRWSVQYLAFHRASPDAPLPSNYERLSVQSQLFGLQSCRQLLEQLIMVSPRFPQFYSNPSIRPKQCMYLRGPEGCGLRTMVVNLCREWRINLLHVSVPVQRSASNYRPGAFLQVLNQALERGEPTVLLLDRMDSHFLSHHFDLAGMELLSGWIQQELHTKTPPAPIWVVITGLVQLEEFAPAMSQFCSTAECGFLQPEELVQIMMHFYAMCLQYLGFQNDRPPIPEAGTDMSHWEQQLQASQFHQLLTQRHEIFTRVVRSITNVDSNQQRAMWPIEARQLVKQACDSAMARSASLVLHGQPVPPDALLPSDQDILAAAHPLYPRTAPPRKQ
jgi:hypothetical protein